MSQYPNFNPATAHLTFPTLVISAAAAAAYFAPENRGEKAIPVKGDPGFIVEHQDGTWEWQSNITDANKAAGNTDAVYQSWVVCDYFRQFAREEHLNADGSETDEGPLKG